MGRKGFLKIDGEVLLNIETSFQLNQVLHPKTNTRPLQNKTIFRASVPVSTLCYRYGST